MRRAMRVRLRSSQRSSSAAAKVTRMRFCNVRPDICNVRHCCMCLGGLPPPLRGGNFFFFFLGTLQNRGLNSHLRSARVREGDRGTAFS